MALSISEHRDLRSVLLLFFPEDREDIEKYPLNEETLALTEKFLFEVDKCSRSIQQLLDYIGGGRLTIGGLRQRALKALAEAAERKDKRLQGVIACSNFGKAAYRSKIITSFAI